MSLCVDEISNAINGIWRKRR